MHQDSREFQTAYREWIIEEKKLAEREISVFSVQCSVKLKENNVWMVSVGIAAALVLAVFTTVAVKTHFFQEPLSKPRYTDEQILESYQGTVKALALCAETISREMDKLKKLDRFSQSLDQLKVLKNSVPSIGNDPDNNEQ